MAGDFILLYIGVSIHAHESKLRVLAYLFQRHPVLNQQSYPRIEISHIFLEDEVLLGLGGDFRFQIAQMSLGCCT